MLHSLAVGPDEASVLAGMANGYVAWYIMIYIYIYI